MRGQWSDDYGMHDHEHTPLLWRRLNFLYRMHYFMGHCVCGVFEHKPGSVPFEAEEQAGGKKSSRVRDPIPYTVVLYCLVIEVHDTRIA